MPQTAQRTRRLKEAEEDRLKEAEEHRLRDAEIGLERTMVKWKIDKYYKVRVCKSYQSYLFVFLFVH